MISAGPCVLAVKLLRLDDSCHKTLGNLEGNFFIVCVPSYSLYGGCPCFGGFGSSAVLYLEVCVCVFVQMISAHYEENPDSFHEEIKQLDQLREVRGRI